MATVKPPHDPHYKATLEVALHGARLRFHVSQDLFSSAFLDPGTGALLRTLAGPEHSRWRKVLDLGAGYGPIGLFLKAWDPARDVHLVDRDSLAVAYSGMNAALNGLEGVTAYASLGYDDVTDRDFDLVACNIPAKAGPRAIESFLLDGRHFLAPGGTMAVVAISRLAPDVRRILGRPDVELLFERENRGYLVAHYRLTADTDGAYASAFHRGVYDRGRSRHAGVDITTVYGLPEFDTPGFATHLALRLLPTLRRAERVLVLNPNQGLVPAAAGRPVAVADRDLLALRNTARNAAVVDAAEPDAVVALLRQGETVAVTLDALSRYRARRVVLAGTSTQVTRLVDALAADVVARDRKKGFSAATVDLP